MRASDLTEHSPPKRTPRRIRTPYLQFPKSIGYSSFLFALTSAASGPRLDRLAGGFIYHLVADRIAHVVAVPRDKNVLEGCLAGERVPESDCHIGHSALDAYAVLARRQKHLVAANPRVPAGADPDVLIIDVHHVDAVAALDDRALAAGQCGWPILLRSPQARTATWTARAYRAQKRSSCYPCTGDQVLRTHAEDSMRRGEIDCRGDGQMQKIAVHVQSISLASSPRFGIMIFAAAKIHVRA